MDNQEFTTTTTQETPQEMEGIQETTINEVAVSIDNLNATITDIRGEFHFAFIITFVVIFFLILGKILKNMIDI